MKWLEPRTYLRLARTVVVLVVGLTVVIIGLLMVLTPGPAVLVVPAGLAILATEFAWARRWLQLAKKKAEEMARSVRRATNSAPANSSPPSDPASGDPPA